MAAVSRRGPRWPSSGRVRPIFASAPRPSSRGTKRPAAGRWMGRSATRVAACSRPFRARRFGVRRGPRPASPVPTSTLSRSSRWTSSEPAPRRSRTISGAGPIPRPGASTSWSASRTARRSSTSPIREPRSTWASCRSRKAPRRICGATSRPTRTMRSWWRTAPAPTASRSST